MKNTKIKEYGNYKGFIEPIITSDNYILGAGNLPIETLVENGDWSQWLPTEERQSKREMGLETYNCTAFGTLNALETLMYRKYGVRVNYSDRWVGIIAGTGANMGNDPHTVAEAIRKYGLIPEEMLPFSDDITTREEYFSFKGANEAECVAEGKRWLEKYDFGHEWIFTNNQSLEEVAHNMRVALKSCPPGIAVAAWKTNEQGYYVPFMSPNHWSSAYATAGTNLTHDFDSYEPYRKILLNNIFYAKRYTIVKKEQKPNIVTTFVNWLINATSTNAISPKVVIAPSTPTAPETTTAPTNITPKTCETSKYKWNTPAEARHSSRVIMDEEGLTYKNLLIDGKVIRVKDLLCAVLQEESGFNIKAKHQNKDKYNSVDYGICQYNSHWYIGEGKPIASIDEALNNPEKCIRVFIKQYKKGRLIDWWAYKNQSYKKHL